MGGVTGFTDALLFVSYVLLTPPMSLADQCLPRFLVCFHESTEKERGGGGVIATQRAKRRFIETESKLQRFKILQSSQTCFQQTFRLRSVKGYANGSDLVLNLVLKC